MIATTLKVLSPVRHLQRLMLKYVFATEFDRVISCKKRQLRFHMEMNTTSTRFHMETLFNVCCVPLL